MLEVARESIQHGLAAGRPLPVDPAEYAEPLREQRACFVTLNLADELRGCIGHLEPIQPLIQDIADNAFAAAFRDPRFPPLSAGEYPDLTVHVSILSLPEPMQVASEADLLAQLRPGVDGLILEEGRRRGTFLPSVWESLPDPREFLRHLKYKAGMSESHWSANMTVARYTTESFGDA